MFLNPTLSQHNLHDVIQGCFDKHLFQSAVFYANQLVSFNGDPENVYLLAQAFFFNEQYHQAAHLLKQHQLVPRIDVVTRRREEKHHPLKYRYLASLCEVKCRKWDEALKVLGDMEPLKEEISSCASHALSEQSSQVCLEAAVCLNCAKIYQSTGDRESAVEWYKQGVKCDARLFEAFEALIDCKMLAEKEEEELFRSLKFPQGYEWLRLMYEAKIQQYNQSSDTAIEKFKDVEKKCSLKDNLYIMTGIATQLFYRNNFIQCYEMLHKILKIDPYTLKAFPIYICTLVELEKTTELFRCAHKVVESYPKHAVSWFAVGCYYYLVQTYDEAKRYFSKATAMDSQFAPAWIGYGHAFACQDESDQAMAAYRNASRLAPGSHIPQLFIGMEYLHTNNVNLAEQFLKRASISCSTDPLIYNELGVCSYKTQQYEEAVGFFRYTIKLISNESTDSWEAVFFNLGHTYRKLGHFGKAIENYKVAFSISPQTASICSAIGFTYHLQNQLENAVTYYHKALGLHERDTFTSDMLTKALAEMFSNKNIDS